MAKRAIIFSGGPGHPFAESSAALAAIAAAQGWQAAACTNLDDAVAGLADADLLIVNALAWSMSQDEKYAPLRDRFALHMTDAQMNDVARFVERGGKLLAMHTAVICFDTQPRWRALLGGGWTWGVSHHPSSGAVTVQLNKAGRALSGQSSFQVRDEVYHDLELDPACAVLATADVGHGPQPVAWTLGDNVAVDALGHDVASLSEPGHRALIEGLLRWLRGA